MNSLRDVLETMGQVTLFVVCGLAASLPATLMMYLAIERESWLLGVLTFVLFVLTVTWLLWYCHRKANGRAG